MPIKKPIVFAFALVFALLLVWLFRAYRPSGADLPPDTAARYAEARRLSERFEDAKSVAMLKELCSLGHEMACADVTQSEDAPGKGRIAYDALCTKGNLDACGELGIFFEEDGETVEAARLYAMACPLRPQYCINLGQLEGRRGNAPEKRRRLQQACDGGSAKGCLGLAKVDLEANGFADAEAKLGALCDKSTALACDDLGQHLETQGRKAEAIPLYRRACVEEVDLLACSHLAIAEPSEAYLTLA